MILFCTFQSHLEFTSFSCYSKTIFTQVNLITIFLCDIVLAAAYCIYYYTGIVYFFVFSWYFSGWFGVFILASFITFGWFFCCYDQE